MSQRTFNLNSSLLLPFAGLGAIFLVIFGLVYFLIGDTTYSYHNGIVCCLSDKLHPSPQMKASTYKKMMIVVLDDGREVDVPIFDIPYIAGHRLLVRETISSKRRGSRFTALRYLPNEST